ncbi:MAG: glutathione peroxidase [Clostridiales bacterium]|nr:glutathione peroxidase [Clostridiales bacterium]
MKIYEYSYTNADDEQVSLSDYKGKVMLLVNTASKCGFTPQYEGLEALYQAYHNKGLEVVGFPCNQFLDQEPGTAEEIRSFCQLNYGVSFELSQKLEVRGETADPLFKYLTSKRPFEGYDMTTEGGKKMQGFLSEKLPHLLEGDDIKWNFTKFLVSKDGAVIKRYESTVDPKEMIKDIEALL